MISDYSGQGTIRNIWPFSTINAIYGPKNQIINAWFHNFITDEAMLRNAAAIYLQRQITPDQLAGVKFYKENQKHFGYKIVWDMDDMIWGHNELQGGSKNEGIPSYNRAWPNITDEMKESSVEVMKLCDVNTFSTQYLCDYVEKEFNITNTKVIPNTVLKSYWGNPKREAVTDIVKPKVIYTGSPTHYDNSGKLFGDWDNQWKEYIIQAVNNNEIDMYFMGGLPWFFDCIKSKVTVMPFLPIFAMHLEIKKIQPHFCINPLVENQFNSAKSDLKLVESAAAGMVCLGTTFDNSVSPYDNCHKDCQVNHKATVDEIREFIKKLSAPEKFNSIIKWQDDWMELEGRYTESPTNIHRLMETVL